MKASLRKGALLAAAAMVASAATGSNMSEQDVKTLHNTHDDLHAQLPKIRDYGTPPDVFGRLYAGSSLKRKNDIRRKHNRKYHQ